jgi:hypothetical protein
MKKVPLTINLVTLYAVIFQAAIIIALPFNILFMLLLLAPLPVVYMLYVILKHGKPSAHTFDERFYDDHDYVRNGKEEMDTVL